MLLAGWTMPALGDTLELDAGKGLSALEAELVAVDQPTANQTFALGAVRFLRGIERTLQERYRSNAAVGSQWTPVPVLRLPFEPNPDPEPFQPEMVRDIFDDLTSDMEIARNTLSKASLGIEDKVQVDLGQLWLDIDGDGVRGDDEALIFIVAASLADPRLVEVSPGEAEPMLVRFDAADVQWFAAYTHFLSAISEFVIAFDPTETIRHVLESRDRMDALRGSAEDGMFFSPDDAAFADAFATIYGAINREPDQQHLVRARDHFLGMVRANRAFWEAVSAETDDDAEWIPNGSQSAALGFQMPPDTGPVWLGVLQDAEAVLTGEKLVGHWRLGADAGINVAKLIENPPAVDIVTWFQGEALVPFMEKGEVASWQNTQRFMRMFQGGALLFMVLLN
jgi:hypothetical protein